MGRRSPVVAGVRSAEIGREAADEPRPGRTFRRARCPARSAGITLNKESLSGGVAVEGTLHRRYASGTEYSLPAADCGAPIAAATATAGLLPPARPEPPIAAEAARRCLRPRGHGGGLVGDGGRGKAGTEGAGDLVGLGG